MLAAVSLTKQALKRWMIPPKCIQIPRCENQASDFVYVCSGTPNLGVFTIIPYEFSNRLCPFLIKPRPEIISLHRCWPPPSRSQARETAHLIFCGLGSYSMVFTKSSSIIIVGNFLLINAGRNSPNKRHPLLGLLT